MKLTHEQQNVIASNGDIKINAVAGSGKTTTVIEYAKSRPRKSKILYLAFNKSVKDEAKEKFAKAGLYNVKVETAHSLAFRYIVPQKGYQVNSKGYKTHELVELLELEAFTDQQKHAQYILANHVNKYLAYYSNSDATELKGLDYLKVVKDHKARAFVRTFKKAIFNKTLLFWSKMEQGAIDITHDFYLKQFQLSRPKLGYDYILFDEGQDASPAMLDVFLDQKATKVIVGDAHQQIYAWRYAVNSLDQVTFPDLYLGRSFRFGQPIAQLAISILQWKKHLGVYNEYALEGAGSVSTSKSKAVLARTNLGLLLKAIDYVTEKDKTAIYFEGNLGSYTYASDGTSLYDVLNLFLKKKRLIKSPVIRQMKDLQELEEYSENTEDHELIMLAHAVRTHEAKLPDLIQKLKDRQVERAEAEIIFSTVHRSKGMEYDEVQLVNDFITEKKLIELIEDDEKQANRDSLIEEVNLLYVAITRAKQRLYLPETLLPESFDPHESIISLKVPKEEEPEPPSDFQKLLASTPFSTSEKTYSLDVIRQAHPNAYRPWTAELDDELTVMYCEGQTVKEMASHFGRNAGAIHSRIRKLELKELYG